MIKYNWGGGKVKKALVIIVAVLLIAILGIFIYMRAVYLSKDEIKNIVIENTNLNSEEVYFDEVDLDIEKGIYEVEFYYNNQKYKYKIDAKNGRIIYTDYINTTSSSNSDANTSTETTTDTTITLDEAKNIALTDSDLTESDVVFTETKSDYKKTRLIYEIEFIYNNQEFCYEIDASTGEIISYSRENIG